MLNIELQAETKADSSATDAQLTNATLAQNAMLAAVRCIDIELSIFRLYDIRQHVIVPNISNQMFLVPFETDMLVLTQSGYATGFEIKVSKSDLLADLRKGTDIRLI